MVRQPRSGVCEGLLVHVKGRVMMMIAEVVRASKHSTVTEMTSLMGASRSLLYQAVFVRAVGVLGGVLVGVQVGDSVGGPVGGSVGDSVGEPVGDSVGDSVGDPVGDSVGVPVAVPGVVPVPVPDVGPGPVSDIVPDPVPVGDPCSPLGEPLGDVVGVTQCAFMGQRLVIGRRRGR